MVHVIPAIIPKSFEDLKEQVSRVKDFVTLVQVDVMDGTFTPTVSWPYDAKHHELFAELKEQREGFPYWVDVNFEVDLMVREPEKHIEEWIEIGASAVIVHIDSTERLDEVIQELRAREVGVGLAFKPSEELSNVEPWISKVDFIQCMGNDKIGYHNVELDERVLGRMRDLRSTYEGLIIGVDIGVHFDTAPKLIAAGANRLVSGSAIFSSDNIGEAIDTLAHAGE